MRLELFITKGDAPVNVTLSVQKFDQPFIRPEIYGPTLEALGLTD
jgi:hypothetical protein